MTSTYSAAQLFKVGSPLRDVKFSASPSVPSTKIRIAVSYVALSPLDIWRSKFGLLVKAENLPMTLGGTFAGKVLQIGDEVPKNLEFGVQVGELVSGWAGGLSGSMQEILDVEWWCVSKVSIEEKRERRVLQRWRVWVTAKAQPTSRSCSFPLRFLEKWSKHLLLLSETVSRLQSGLSPKEVSDSRFQSSSRIRRLKKKIRTFWFGVELQVSVNSQSRSSNTQVTRTSTSLLLPSITRV